MKTLWAVALVLFAVPVSGETPVPPTVEFVFDPVAAQAVKTVRTGEPRYLKSIQRDGGVITNGWWNVPPGTAFGQGTLQFNLDRAQLSGDLALVLRSDWQSDTNIAVQLFDAEGRAIALDLFGETAHNARTVGTDTFVIPLSRYPNATAIAVRRLSGDLRILGGGLYPVLSEVTAKAENERELAQQLGLIISPHHWMFATSGKEGVVEMEFGVGQVHTVAPLNRVNEIGAAALTAPGYPKYAPLTSAPLVPIKFSASGTTYEFITKIVRQLALASGSKPLQPSFPSSDGVAERLLHKDETLGFMSIPLSSAEKEQFFRQHGFPILEIKVARDAIEVLVNKANPITHLTSPQLDAIFGTELRAGAPKAITRWEEIGGSGGTIEIVGGSPGWGTSRMFQQFVLKGGPFREGMLELDVADPSGVEQSVGEQPNRIGFASYRPRGQNAHALAIAANSGEAAYRADTQTVYSGKYPLQRMFYGYVAARSLNDAAPFEREMINLLLSDMGQTIVARSGSLPLSATETAAARADLGLPR